MRTREQLVRATEDTMFAWCDVPGYVSPLSIPGVRGGLTRSFNPYANRVGADGLDPARADAAIAEVLALFRHEGKGFTWAVGPCSTPADLGARLHHAGLRPAERLAGMARTDLDAPHRGEARGLELRAATADDLRRFAGAMAACYGMPEAWMQESNAFLLHRAHAYRTHVYLAFVPEQADPVAFGTVVLFHRARIALLAGAGTHPDHRGRGVYRAVLNRRLRDAAEAGCEAALVQADRRTSAPILAREGFEELSEVRMHTWTPAGGQVRT